MCSPDFGSNGPSWPPSQVRTAARIALPERDLRDRLRAEEVTSGKSNPASRNKGLLPLAASAEKVRHEEKGYDLQQSLL